MQHSELMFWFGFTGFANSTVALSLILFGCVVGNVIVTMLGGIMIYALILNQILIRHVECYLLMDGHYILIFITEFAIAAFFILLGIVTFDVVVIIAGTVMFHAFMVDKCLEEDMRRIASYSPV